MPYYSDELIEEIRARNDIVDVISGYVRLQKKGSTYFGLCPFHNEKSPSFSVTPSKQMYYCFGCGAGGNVFTFLMEYENFTFQEALQTLADKAGVALPTREMTSQQKAESDKRSRILEINKEAAKYFYILLRKEHGIAALDYFKKRELSDETMHRFGLGYSDKFSNDLYKYLRSKGYEDDILKDSGLISYDEVRGGHDKFWNRAMFPIMDVHNKVIGFGGRVLGEGEPKYLNSPETKVFDKSRNLYALNIARTSKRQGIILCEGYMDVIALHQAGFDNAVASLGTAFTNGHANLLKRYTKEVYLTFDSDGAGIKAALRALPILKEAGLSGRVINLKPYKDPDEFIKANGAKDFQERIKEAENSFMFEIRMMQENYNLQDPESKTEFFNQVAIKLLGFSQELERNNYIEAIAQKYQIGFDTLRKLVEHFGTQGMTVRSQRTNEESLPKARERAKKKEDGMKQSQKLILTWLLENHALFLTIEKYIQPSDFTEPLYEKAAEILYQQLRADDLNPGKIVSMFETEEEQREIASIFNARIHEMESTLDMQKAIKETIIRVKQNSIAKRSKELDPTDFKGILNLVNEKKDLEKIQINIE